MTLLTASLSKTFLLELAEKLVLCRAIDKKMAILAKQNLGGNFHLDTAGHELVGLLFGMMLGKETDWGFPYYRDRAFAIGKGVSVTELFEVFLARASKHHSGGRMMPDHFSQRELKLAVRSSPVGAQLLQAVGTALAVKWKKTGEVVYVSIGEGGTSQGDYHEALNFAAIYALPVVFVVQDNGYAISVTKAEQTAGESVEGISSGYEGLEVFSVNGSDLEGLHTAYSAAILRARSLQGPSVIVAQIRRLGAHSSSDDPNRYKSPSEIEKDKKADPLRVMKQYFDEKEWNRIIEEADERTEEAAQKAKECPQPLPETAAQYVFAPSPVEVCAEPVLGPESVMVDAINHALKEEMKRDTNVVVFGQDVARSKGGVFGATKELTSLFGEERCFNTPLAESTIVGIAIGLAMEGTFNPVTEIQFADYMWTAMNQIVNELSSAYYRSNGMYPMRCVIRMPVGGYIQGGPYHSQSVEAFLAHVPGLKIAYPSNSFDAKALLKTAVRDPNPVLFLEHKGIYRRRGLAAQQEGDEETLLPFGRAKTVREGEELTVVAWGMAVHMVFEVLQMDNLDVELIDLRTISPWDSEAVLLSVKKTGKLLIVHEAPLTGGFGAEIAAVVSEKAFSFLDAPVRRVGALDVPVPYSKILETAVLPSRETIKEAIEGLMRF